MFESSCYRSSMRDARRGGVVAAIALVIIAGVAGCAGGSSPGPAVTGPRAPATTAGAATTSASQPAAVATESNPPGDIPDNQAFVAYTSPADGFLVKVPEGWGRTRTGQT